MGDTAARKAKTVTKKDIAEQITAVKGLSQADRLMIVQEVLHAVTDGLSRGMRIELRDFGVFEVKTLAARRAQNPRTLEPVVVPTRATVRFRPGKKMREQINDGLDGQKPASFTEDKPRPDSPNQSEVIAKLNHESTSENQAAQ